MQRKLRKTNGKLLKFRSFAFYANLRPHENRQPYSDVKCTYKHRLLHRRISPPRDNPKSHSQNYDHSSRKPTEIQHQKELENLPEMSKAETEGETSVSPKA